MNKQEEWKKCPGCLCKGKCPPRGLDGCHIMGCAGRADSYEIPKKEKKVPKDGS